MVVITNKRKIINKYQSEQISKLKNELKKIKIVCQFQVKMLRAHNKWSKYSAELITPLMRGDSLSLTAKEHLDVLKNRQELYNCYQYVKNEFEKIKNK